ncbi:hypothetical protein [Curtobacterium sp. MCBD17_008]|uniref:hypothetical protein n=1 Tax=Curtobacterium sp. MCBD17_008 TaxID=2175656 RepID=UPI000DA8599E|nr:hypothetical protein [Curtobacterium sp. MCBD17_008]PZE90430.1 hypothetical protein DEI95_11775 [Curtobacterium sp. MCBD17_008]
MTLEKLRELSVLDAAFMIRVGHADARIEDVFPSLTAEKVAQVWKRVYKFEDVTFRWGAEHMDLVYQRGLDDESRERAFKQLRERHDREYDARWTDFSKSSRSAGEGRGQIANR